MVMCDERIHERGKVQRLDRIVCPPILEAVPGMRPRQINRFAGAIREVVGIGEKGPPEGGRDRPWMRERGRPSAAELGGPGQAGQPWNRGPEAGKGVRASRVRSRHVDPPFLARSREVKGQVPCPSSIHPEELPPGCSEPEGGGPLLVQELGLPG